MRFHQSVFTLDQLNSTTLRKTGLTSVPTILRKAPLKLIDAKTKLKDHTSYFIRAQF